MSPQEKFSVLIVDDEKSNLDVLNHILSEKYTVYIAKSGENALKKAKENKPDLILLDVVMPGMNGFEVLAGLKKEEEIYAIPVIFITGLSNASNEEKGLLLGAVDYITKPFHPTIVLARVNTQIKIIEQIRTIERMGMIDSVTGIPNKHRFETMVRKEWLRALRDSQPVGLISVRVEDFGKYVQEHGPVRGDMLLQMVAMLLNTTIKRPMDAAARVAAERFAVLLPNTIREGVLSLAEEIRNKVSMSQLTASVSTLSASKIPQKGDSFEEFIAEILR